MASKAKSSQDTAAINAVSVIRALRLMREARIQDRKGVSALSAAEMDDGLRDGATMLFVKIDPFLQHHLCCIIAVSIQIGPSVACSDTRPGFENTN